MTTPASQPSEEIMARVRRLLGWAPQQWRRVTGGYTPAARFVVADARRSAFVKVATSRVTARMLRHEAAVYPTLEGPFVPAFRGWEDDPEAPLLIIEDLSGARWPPPWDAASVAVVREAIADMHGCGAESLTPAEAHFQTWTGWDDVAADPAPFLSLGMASSAWLDRSLPALVAAEAGCPLAGEALCHFDLRSDNICITASGVKFIDWAAACRGNPAMDLGGWLPSLQYEGGPAPEAVIGRAPEVAAKVSGYFAARAGLPNIPDAPFVRRVQREQLSTALPWVVRALGLPAPDR